jgi:acetyltransferase-like isoleucine patch superfamily enzyme
METFDMGLFSRLTFNIKYWGIHRGNPVSYLRSAGGRVGQQVEIFTNVRNLGSEPWLIEIGHRVTLAGGVVVLTHDGSSRLFREHLPGMNRFGNKFGTVTVHDDCFIGTNAIILPGVTIGPGSIVGAGSVVTKDVLPNTVVAGNPVRVICTLDEYIDRYRSKMLVLQASDRRSLRKELTKLLWGDER